MSAKGRLLHILDEFGNRKLVVIGDIIADQFLYGQISRVSREAPVLVLQYNDTALLPGGAANAANNLLELGCDVSVVGAVGRDDAGISVRRMLADRGADVRLLKSNRYCSTPVKTRILASAPHSSPQQVVRLDRVSKAQFDFRGSTRRLERIVGACDGVIISDYGCGTVSPGLVKTLSRAAKERKCPIVVDSRFGMDEYEGVTAITPNITEVEAALGTVIGNDAELLESLASGIMRRQRLECLLVTQGRFGMTLFRKRKKPFHINIYGSDEVADVTGAGDTVIAVFTLALAAGGSPEEAALLANYAGGIVVMKRGTATVNRRELREAIDRDLS